jgi:hypothetical protein
MELPIKPLLFALFLLAPCTGFAAPAAAPATVTKMPEHTVFLAPETHTPIRVKPRKPQVVHLDADIGRTVVDDKPGSVSIITYGSRSVVLFPHSKQDTAHITIFGKDGKPLMARYVVIEDPNNKYIRMHQVCKKGQDDAECKKTNIYYCPNLCYKTQLVGAAASFNENRK